MGEEHKKSTIHVVKEADAMSAITQVTLTIPPDGDVDYEAFHEALDEAMKHNKPATLDSIKEEIGYNAMLPLSETRQSEDLLSDAEFDHRRAYHIQRIEQRLSVFKTHPDFNELEQMINNCIALGIAAQEHEIRRKHLRDAKRAAESNKNLNRSSDGEPSYNERRTRNRIHWHSVVKAEIEARTAAGFIRKPKTEQAEILRKHLKRKHNITLSKRTIENALYGPLGGLKIVPRTDE